MVVVVKLLAVSSEHRKEILSAGKNWGAKICWHTQVKQVGSGSTLKRAIGYRDVLICNAAVMRRCCARFMRSNLIFAGTILLKLSAGDACAEFTSRFHCGRKKSHKPLKLTQKQLNGKNQYRDGYNLFNPGVPLAHGQA